MVPCHGRSSVAHGDLDVDTTSKNGEHTSRSEPFRMNVLLSKDGHSKSHASYFDGRSPSIPKYSEKWACDYCQVATFATFQDACNHEDCCKMNPKQIEKVTASRAIVKCKERKSEPNTIAATVKSTVVSSPPETKLLLCMPTDRQSLSDRQCYVRSNFVEIFEATEADVSIRHSRGAQKLRVGQIGLRCIHCSHLRDGRKRAERATCFPSSISRIYQTVADMQRFHFEACTGIPEVMKAIYRNLKTTRPRGQGSPQSYWAKSAKDLGLVDTSEGIRLSKEWRRRSLQQKCYYNNMLNSFSSSSSPPKEPGKGPLSYHPISPFMSEEAVGLANLPPLSPESQSSHTTMSSAHKNTIPDEEDANILLALRAGNISQTNMSKQSQ